MGRPSRSLDRAEGRFFSAAATEGEEPAGAEEAKRESRLTRTEGRGGGVPAWVDPDHGAAAGGAEPASRGLEGETRVMSGSSLSVLIESEDRLIDIESESGPDPVDEEEEEAAELAGES